MLRKIIFGALILTLLNSCVSAKVYKDLEDRYADLSRDRDELSDANQGLTTEKNRLENELAVLRSKYDKASGELARMTQDYKATRSNLENLQNSYDALEKNSSSALAENTRRNRELLIQLEEKEKALAAENARLLELRRQLEARSGRVNELEAMIASKDAAMRNLKDAVSRALLDFEGKGLTVEQRNGKVYVSMENKLLFESGSWAVGSEGKRAVQQLGNVLADNPEIAILIEGHTDNVPYNGRGELRDNWDLSTKRATAIVHILRENRAINPMNLTAAGRGEYAPVASNETTEGRSKNRRIDVILTPKLDEVTKLLDEI